MRPLLCLIARACCVIVTASAANVAAQLAVPDELQARTLANGLEVIVWPDHDIPNVALYNFVRAGGRNEVPGITGLSHFFEHMMFNGTTTRPPGEFDRVMEAAGGANNAYTSGDLTVYMDWFPASALALVFDLEADRLANLSFAPDVVESERGVVTSERRSSVDNRPWGSLYEAVQATAFVAHPYQQPVIGWPADIASWQIDDLKAYFRTYYAPNNCTLVVVGDVEPEQVFALARKTIGKIPAQAPPPEVRTAEPPQPGERRVFIERDVQAPLLAMAWKSGAADAPDARPIELLLHVLAGGESSRLYRELVEPGHVLSIESYRDEGFDPGLVWLLSSVAPGGDLSDVEQRIDRVLAELIEGGVTPAELARAKRVKVADFYNGLATINGKAAALGRFAVFHGNYLDLFDAPARYSAVTAEQLQQAAQRLFDARRRTVGVLAPEVGS